MRRALGNLLLLLGLGLLILTVALYGYGEYERRQIEETFRDIERRDAATTVAEDLGRLVAAAQARGIAATSPTAGPLTPTVVSAETTPVAAVPIVTPLTEPSPTVTAIRRILAKSIDLDSPVVEAKVENGEWQVPKFVAGHLQGTALPGTGGNVVLSGHVQSLTSGNVFARLDELKLGDSVTLRTNLGEVNYRITGKNVVPNNDLSVVKKTDREEVTLITCTGTFNPITSDYSHRIVVWGERGA